MIGTLGGAAKLNHTVFKSITHDDARPLLLDTAITVLVSFSGPFALVVDVEGCVCSLPALCIDSDDLNENLILSLTLVSPSFCFPSALGCSLSLGVFGVVGFFKLLFGNKFSPDFCPDGSSFPVECLSVLVTSRLLVESTTVLILSSLFSDFSNCELKMTMAEVFRIYLDN